MRDARNRPALSRLQGHEMLYAAVSDSGALRASHARVCLSLAGSRIPIIAVCSLALSGLKCSRASCPSLMGLDGSATVVGGGLRGRADFGVGELCVDEEL